MDEIVALVKDNWGYIVASAPFVGLVAWKFFKKRASKTETTLDDDLVESIEEVIGKK